MSKWSNCILDLALFSVGSFGGCFFFHDVFLIYSAVLHLTPTDALSLIFTLRLVLRLDAGV